MTDFKIIRQKYEENQDFIILNYLPNMLIKYKGKDNNFILEKPGRSHLYYVIKLITSVIMNHLIWFTKNDTALFLWYSFKKCITSLLWWEIIRQTQIQRHLTKQLTIALQLSMWWKRKAEKILQAWKILKRNNYK